MNTEEHKKKVIFVLTGKSIKWLKEIAKKNHRTQSGQIEFFIEEDKKNEVASG